MAYTLFRTGKRTEIKQNLNENTPTIQGYSLETEKSNDYKRVATYITHKKKVTIKWQWTHDYLRCGKYLQAIQSKEYYGKGLLQYPIK